MAQKSSEERTEKPTPKKVKELRKKNTVLRSQEMVSAVGLAAIVAVAPFLIVRAWEASQSILRRAFVESGTSDIPQALEILYSSVAELSMSVALPVGAVLFAVALTGLALTKGKPNPYAIKPRPDLLNPKLGVKRVLGVQGLVEASKGLVKLSAVALAVWTVLPAAYALLLAGPPSIEDFLAELGTDVSTLAWRLVAVGVVVGLLDLAWSYRQYIKQARMTKTEVRQEFKGSEGDPMIKAARRQAAARLSRERMIDDVKTATVVVTNPTHISMALRYQPGDFAPVVVARGAGVIALKIRERAAASGIPVRENKILARSLYRSCRTGDTIPADLYEAVAVILAEVMKASKKKGVR